MALKPAEMAAILPGEIQLQLSGAGRTGTCASYSDLDVSQTPISPVAEKEDAAVIGVGHPRNGKLRRPRSRERQVAKVEQFLHHGYGWLSKLRSLLGSLLSGCRIMLGPE